VEAYTKPILLIGRENMNRVVQGDIVVVEVFGEQEWKAPTEEVIDQDCKSEFVLAQIVLTKLKLRSRTMMQKSPTRRVKELLWMKRRYGLSLLLDQQPRSSPRDALLVSSRGTGERMWSSVCRATRVDIIII
jgi:exoribonuclease R